MDYHPWEFSGKRKKIMGVQSSFNISKKEKETFDMPNYYAEDITVAEILEKEKQKLTYWYDFGDDWIFDIILQKIFPKNELNPKIKKIPFLLKAKGPMLLEDIGGIHFWEEIIETYEQIEKGESVKINNAIERVVSDRFEKGTEIGMYEAIVSELYETDWKKFDIEENIFSLKDEIYG